LVRTGKIAGSAALDLCFDLYYGTETMRWVWTEDLGANSEHDANAVGYRATKARPLQKLIRKLDLPRDRAFVDLGSGKGRVLLLAAQLGFQHVVGVEFSPKLCAIARANVGIFTRQLTKITSYIEVTQADAALFNITPEHCIFYAFNPFDGVVMERLIANLRESLARHPRKIWFLYNTPLHAHVLEQLFSSAQDFEIGGTEFKVYKNF
jgi:SAM-dependent methyltransferase